MIVKSFILIILSPFTIFHIEYILALLHQRQPAGISFNSGVHRLHIFSVAKQCGQPYLLFITVFLSGNRFVFSQRVNNNTNHPACQQLFQPGLPFSCSLPGLPYSQSVPGCAGLISFQCIILLMVGCLSCFTNVSRKWCPFVNSKHPPYPFA